MVASSPPEKAGDVLIAKRQKNNQGMHWSFHGSEPQTGQQRFEIDNCAISYFKMRGQGIRMEFSNRVDHLPPYLQESESTKLRSQDG